MDDDRIDDLEQQVRDRGIRQVRIVFFDYNGIARARSVSVDALASVFRRGVNFSSPTVAFNSRDLFPRSASFDLTSPDFWARPDPTTFRSLSSAPEVGMMYADLITSSGAPWAGCPRTALRLAIDAAARRGLRFNVGFEPEGYIFRPGNGDVEPVGVSEFATLAGLDLEPAFMRDLLNDLASAGLVVEQWSEEYGPGQIEVNLHHADALAAADALATFKEIFRAAAGRHGMLGTFMPKPRQDLAGTGLHVHLSASPIDGQESNLFDDPSDLDLGLSQLGRRALAGLLAHGEGLTALGATTVNSYKRFLPGSWAPTHIMYAYASRAAFVRIPERETPRRLELRVGDGSGNPHLFLTGIVAAMMDGIGRELDPGSPVQADVGALSDEEAVARGARPLPRTLGEALDRLEADEVLRSALGPVIGGELLRIKRSEWESFCMHVGDWDRSWYLGRY